MAEFAILDAEGRPIRSGSTAKIYSRDDVRQIRDICLVEDAETFALDLLLEGLTIEQARRRIEELAPLVDQQLRKKPHRRTVSSTPEDKYSRLRSTLPNRR
jgi:hypothetical protein